MLDPKRYVCISARVGQFNFLDDWQNQINHLLAQEEAHRRELSGDLREALVQLSI